MTTSPTRVLGLAGGIGAGKSAVAAILRDLGCVVSDSDARAKALLDTPPVRDQIVAWWGPELLTPDARIDRVRLAAVVFADPDQRRRLEGLIHPLLKTERDAALARARAARAPAFVIDAPLLFEAGLHRECDAVIFVDAPRELCLRRVAQSRGWSPGGFLPDGATYELTVRAPS